MAKHSIAHCTLHEHERDKYEGARENARGWFASIEEMFEALDKAEAAGSAGEADSAMETIHQSVLSVLVRDGWHTPGTPSEDGPEEYEILLSTGGPALRIWGKLDAYSFPNSAELQMQDWFIPWSRHDCNEEMLLRFAQQFYFGD